MPSVYEMVSGIGKSFGDSYTAARKQALEEEAPDLIVNLMSAYQGGSATPAVASAAPAADATGARAAPTFAATGGAMGDYLSTTRAKESGGDDAARNPNSTATGRYQFTADTWNGLAKKYPDLGLTANGRTDPAQQERAMQAFTRDNADALSRVGIPINPGNLYVSHFLGEAGGPKFIAGAMSNPDAPAVQFVSPGAARANRSIFFNADGSPKTAGAVYQERTSRYAGGGPVATPTLPGASAPVALANSEAEVQALESRMGMMPRQAATSTVTLPNGSTAEYRPATDSVPGGLADLPAADARPAGFQIPGQPAPAAAAPAAQGFAGFGSPATRITPQMQSALTAAWRNPETRAFATQIYGNLLKGKESAWSLTTMGDQPVLFNQSTAQIIPVGQGKRQTATVGNSVIDVTTGQPIFTAPDKDENKLQSVAPGTTLYDPRARQPVFTAPTAEDKDEGAKVTAQIGAREKAAEGLGLVKGTPAWQSFVGTGKIGRDQDLSATDKKAIQEADELVLSAQTAIGALNEAKALSKQAYEGPTAGTRSAVTSLWGSDSGVATEDLHNVVVTNALGQLKAIFGGNPTEGERKILLEIQGSVNKPDVVRQKIFDRGIALAQKRLDFNQRRAEDLRGGTYYKQDGATGRQDGAIPKGTDRVAIPNGMSAGAAIAEARAKLKERPDLKPQFQERLRSWGIDPKRLED